MKWKLGLGKSLLKIFNPTQTQTSKHVCLEANKLPLGSVATTTKQA